MKRLIVLYEGKYVYDEKFSLGVNIIRGENSSGKSTIMDLIVFAFGGEITQWKKEAAMCDCVFAEVSINNSTITLKREIEEKRGRPMEIFWGSFEAASNSAGEDWQKYPFQRSESKESFSQVLFRALEMPEVRGDKSLNITMHQILRLIYVDQVTPFDRLFRFEQFDSALHRNTISDLMCGFYDNILYEKQLKLDQNNKQYDAIEHDLKNIYRILGAAEQEMNLKKLEAVLSELKHKSSELYDELRKMKESPSDFKDKVPDLASNIRNELTRIKSDVADLQDEKEQLVFEIEDSRQFIDTLRNRLEALFKSNVTRSALGEIIFEFCPSCLAPINDEYESSVCSLCKSKRETKEDFEHPLRMQQEMELQIFESTGLLEDRKRRLAEIDHLLPSLLSRKDELRYKYDSIERAATTEYEAVIEDISRQIGYIERSIENVHERAKLLSTIEELVLKKGELNSEISILKDEIASLKESQVRKKEIAYSQIADLTVQLLKSDLEREESFQRANAVSFNFGDDNISVDGRRQFAASSMVYLRNSFHFALLWASAIHSFFNYPRLAIFDNIEDKGMELARSHNFQLTLVNLSEKMGVDHQIIFTTSMVAPDLNNSKYTVGDYYNHNNKSLRMN